METSPKWILVLNANVVWEMPFGAGRTFLANAGKLADGILGGGQLSGIFRWNTGLPTGISRFDEAQWATNWNVQSNSTPSKHLNTCANKPANAAPKLFGGCDVTQIYQGFRNAYPGETGPRNLFRYPGCVDLDLGLSKSWKMPWNETHLLQIRWDVFNVTNTQRLFGIADFAVSQIQDSIRRALHRTGRTSRRSRVNRGLCKLEPAIRSSLERVHKAGFCPAFFFSRGDCCRGRSSRAHQPWQALRGERAIPAGIGVIR